jgi:hypothetical protein
MANSGPSNNVPPPHRRVSVFAAVLSYLIPGLGQIYQGRVGKGILFFVCLYGLFFTGMAMGDWKVVYLPEVDARARDNAVSWLPGPLKFVAEFLPASVLNRPQFAGQFWIGIAAWPAIWQYNHPLPPGNEQHSFWQDFERWPSDENAVNELLRNSDKTPDLGWVYTVIAGVLNILVIYDALAGPAFGTGTSTPAQPPRPQQEPARA